jgi:hypothetical protein
MLKVLKDEYIIIEFTQSRLSRENESFNNGKQDYATTRYVI